MSLPDLIICDGMIVDGTGDEAFRADIAVKDDIIVEIGDLQNSDAHNRVSAKGRCVAPGFIDAHTHDDRVLLSNPDMTAKISQGVTTVVAGNCGVSLSPLSGIDPPPPLNLLGGREWYRFDTAKAYVDELRNNPPAVNYVLLVGHSTLRAATMTRLDRKATWREINEMERLVDESMDAGCSGFSTGLEYPPAINATESEVIQLVKRMSAAGGGIYTSHMRNEADNVHLSIEETVRTAEQANVRTVISHHKTCGKNNFGRTKQTLSQISEAQKKVDLNFDVYPYIASSTSLLPQYIDKAEKIMVTWSDPHPECTGRELSDICSEWNISIESAVEKLSPAGAIYFQMHEDDLQRVLQYPGAMIGSDGLPSDRFPHPRLWGTFPRVIGHYGRDLGLFTIESAVAKMTGNVAETFGLANHGFLKEEFFADIVIFNPETIIDNADFSDPVQKASGIDAVYVGGQLVYSELNWTGKRPGSLISVEYC